ncbi:MAG: EF-hand domain-containing protein [Thermoguttaceae bacterium]
MLRGFDTNRDGVIDPNEVPEDRRRFLGFIGGRMGVDFSKPLAIDKLREKVTEEFGGKKKKEPEPLVPGFGIATQQTTVLAFGQRLPETKPGAVVKPATPRGGPGNEQDARAQGFAEMMMKRYDRDGSGALERDKGEWEGVKGDPNETDRNHDGRIDRDEMVARVASYMGGEQRGGSDRGGGNQGGKPGESDDQSEPSRKSYRFLSAAERLPEGLPSWFSERDGNKDGQVTMAEYSSSWTDSKAREYLHYDLNDDGVVTPEECLVAQTASPVQPSPVAEPQRAPEGGQPAPTADATAAEKKEESPGGEKPWWMSK